MLSHSYLIAGDPNRETMYSNEFQEGIHRFIECKLLHRVFNFVCQYDRRVNSDQWITKTLKSCPGSSFFQIITPSKIAYVISLVKNGQEMWDQEIGVAGNREKGDDEPRRRRGHCSQVAWARSVRSA